MNPPKIRIPDLSFDETMRRVVKVKPPKKSPAKKRRK